MNTTFNFNRFWKVMCNEWRLTWKKVLLFWTIVALFPLSAALGVFVFDLGTTLIDRVMSVALPLAIVVLLQGYYLQFYFREFSSKKKTQFLLLLPASRNEKFWAKFLLGAVLYFFISFAFIFAMLTLTGIINERIWASGLSGVYSYSEFLKFQDITVVADGVLDIVGFAITWLLVASAFLFGLFLFEKNALLKTFVFWILIAIAFQFTLGTSVGMCPNLLTILYALLAVTLITVSRVMFNEKTI